MLAKIDASTAVNRPEGLGKRPLNNCAMGEFLPGGLAAWECRWMPGWILFVERVLPLSILTMAAVGVPVMMLAPEGLPRLRSLSKELTQVEAENADLKQRIQHLRSEVEHLRQDPVAIERIARDELGLVRTSEV